MLALSASLAYGQDNFLLWYHLNYTDITPAIVRLYWKYTIVGSSVNLASRIESSAEPGGICLSEDTWLLVKDDIDCVPASSITPKGFSKPVPLCRVSIGEAEGIYRLKDEGVDIVIDPARVGRQNRGRIRQMLSRLLDEPDE